jgi:hypothetical protein
MEIILKKLEQKFGSDVFTHIMKYSYTVLRYLYRNDAYAYIHNMQLINTFNTLHLFGEIRTDSLGRRSHVYDFGMYNDKYNEEMIEKEKLTNPRFEILSYYKTHMKICNLCGEFISPFYSVGGYLYKINTRVIHCKHYSHLHFFDDPEKLISWHAIFIYMAA